MELCFHKIFAGGHRDNLYSNSNFHLHPSSLLYDWIWVEGREILVVLLLHFDVLCLLHTVRYDGGCFDPGPPNRRDCHVLLSQLLELVFRFSPSQDGTYLIMESCVKLLRTVPITTYFLNGCSKSPSGGDGTIGLLRWRGRYTGLWPLKWVIKMQIWRYLG